MSETITKANPTIKRKLNAHVHIASLACMIHCIITPLIIVGAPVAGSMWQSPIIEVGMLLVSVCCGIVVIHKGFCKHKKRDTIFLFGIGVSLWIGHSIAEHSGWFDSEIYLLVLGTSFVIGSYYYNHRLLKNNTKCVKCCPNLKSSIS